MGKYIHFGKWSECKIGKIYIFFKENSQKHQLISISSAAERKCMKKNHVAFVRFFGSDSSTFVNATDTRRFRRRRLLGSVVVGIRRRCWIRGKIVVFRVFQTAEATTMMSTLLLERTSTKG
jgi:hypothetical protein